MALGARWRLVHTEVARISPSTADSQPTCTHHSPPNLNIDSRRLYSLESQDAQHHHLFRYHHRR